MLILCFSLVCFPSNMVEFNSFCILFYGQRTELIKSVHTNLGFSLPRVMTPYILYFTASFNLMRLSCYCCPAGRACDCEILRACRFSEFCSYCSNTSESLILVSAQFWSIDCVLPGQGNVMLWMLMTGTFTPCWNANCHFIEPHDALTYIFRGLWVLAQTGLTTSSSDGSGLERVRPKNIIFFPG